MEEISFSKEITKLLVSGAISKCTPMYGQYVSPCFLIKKPNGDNRFILNLKKLNSYVQTPHFKMEDYRTVLKLIRKNCFMSTIDLKDAYFLVPISPEHRRFLRFHVNGQLYQFNCLPFGLSVAPYVFTKIIKSILEILRTQGVFCVAYLDDFFICGNTKQECALGVAKVVHLLQSLGFLINKEKSSLEPKKICKFLGFIFNSEEMTIKLPTKKREKIVSVIDKLMAVKQCKIRSFAHCVGLLVSACPAIKYGRLYTKLFEREKFLALKKSNQDYNKQMYLSSSLADDFNWWKLQALRGMNNIQEEVFTLEIYTDASLTGWGAFCNGRSTFGWWTEEDKFKHINFLELKAVLFGLQFFADNCTSCNLLLRIDNTTALAYINRMGSVQYPDLNIVSRKIWQWCESRDIFIKAYYVKSVDNKADKASRILPTETEWELADYAYTQIIERFGSPDIDLFASNRNTKCSRFVSWFPDPKAENVDAFSLNWRDISFYAFPPFSMVHKTLNKIILNKAEGIVVVPLWPAQPWFPLFSQLLVDDPIIFKPNKNLLVSSYCRKHPLAATLSLVAGKLSGTRC